MAISSTGIGSGLDVEKIITQLTALEKQPLTALQTKATTIQSKLSTLATVSSQVSALSVEARQTLAKHRPQTLGLASRMPGITPASLSLLLVHLRKGGFPPRAEIPVTAEQA